VREQRLDGSERSKGDLTATAGAGLKAYLPLGTHGMVAAHALPEYTWWQRESERNAVVGHYGLGAFLWGNRIQGEATARRVEQVTFLSPDLLVREPVQSDLFAASAQVRVLGSIGVFAGGRLDRVRVDANSGVETVDPGTLLDRDSDEVRLGLRYLLRGDRGHVGAGALQEHTDFVGLADATRSNAGSSWYAEAMVRGNHLDVGADVARRDLEPSAGSSFPGYRATDGHVVVAFHPGWRLRFNAYGLRQLTWSARDAGAFLEEERGGVLARSALGSGGVELFYEVGTDRYLGTTLRPDEDVTAYGGAVEFRILRHLDGRVGSRRVRYSVPGGADRKLREVNGALSLTFGSRGEW
jgi:hypothetical protein